MIPDDPDELDLLLNDLMACDTDTHFNRVCCRLYRDKAYGDAADCVWRWLRRRVFLRSPYKPSESNLRRDRSGLKWSWVELKLLRMSMEKLSSETPEGAKVTSATLAPLLQRSVAEIDSQKSIKHGIKGFDIVPKSE